MSLFCFMMDFFTLPTSITIGDRTHEIRTDFRVILEIISMLSDPDLDNADKTEALLEMFYVNPEEIEDYQTAVDMAFQFIDNSRRENKKNSPKLTDWEQDFNFYISPVNHVLGYDARSVAYDVETNTGGLHWWTFLSAFMEISNDCLYSQIISIRDKQARHKPLDKSEKDWARRNADIIRIKTTYSAAEEAILKEWT